MRNKLDIGASLAKAKSRKARASVKHTASFDDMSKELLDVVKKYEGEQDKINKKVEPIVSRLNEFYLNDDIAECSDAKDIKKYVKEAKDFGFEDYEDEDEKDAVISLLDDVYKNAEDLAEYYNNQNSGISGLIIGVQNLINDLK